MNAEETRIGMEVELALPYEQAVQRVTEALRTEGFGVLTEIDVKATLKKKLDAEFRPYVILGACNPPLAHRALSSELKLGLLLPCNVIVYAGDEPSRSAVAVLDPVVQLGVTGRKDLEPLASQVQGLLKQVLERVREAAGTTQRQTRN